jgi:hypothetical protein
MARTKKWFTVFRRSDSKSYRLTLNPTCGLPDRVCNEWYRTSFQHFPAELAHLRNPKNKDAAEAVAQTLIQHLKKAGRGRQC